MKVTVSKVNDIPVLNIEVPLTLTKQSRSGNSTVIATTRGQQFIGQINGKETYLQLNVLQMETTGGLEIEGQGEGIHAADAGQGGSRVKKAS